MKKRDGGIVGYNVQTAVDAKHHLIVAHEVVSAGINREQLTPMAEQARAATGRSGHFTVGAETELGGVVWLDFDSSDEVTS